MQSPADVTLFDKYGGVATVRELVREFYERLHAKPTLRRYFEGLPKERVIKHQIDLITFAMGKPPPDLDVQRLAESHHRLDITPTAYEDTIGILRQVLLEAHVEGRDIALMLSRLDAHRHRIVRNATAPARAFNPDHVDELTGLGNQVAMDAVLVDECRRFHESGKAFSLALCRLTARVGEALPVDQRSLDLLARNFAGALARITRGSDDVFRLNDGLFSVALRATDAERAMIAVKRLRNTLARDAFLIGATRRGIDLEIGVATASDSCLHPDALIDAARQALERASASGTQKVQMAAEALTGPSSVVRIGRL